LFNQIARFLTSFFSGLSASEWSETNKILTDLRSDPGNVVHVTTDAENEVNLIYIQLSEQRELFKRYPEAGQLDGTHRTNQLGMPLYTVLVKDKFGLGQPVFYFFVREETKERILSGLRVFTFSFFLV
jgi:MULE transposase domain